MPRAMLMLQAAEALSKPRDPPIVPLLGYFCSAPTQVEGWGVLWVGYTGSLCKFFLGMAKKGMSCV